MKSVFPVAFSASLFLIPVLVPVVGCNSDSADDTVIEASRAERIENFADKVCDRYEACNNNSFSTADGQPYDSEASCEADYENRAAQAWPQAQCNDRQIDTNNYNACIKQVQDYVCADGFATFTTAIEALDACKAERVCTDPAN